MVDGGRRRATVAVRALGRQDVLTSMEGRGMNDPPDDARNAGGAEQQVTSESPLDAERERTAAALNVSEARLHRALTRIGAGTWEWDLATGENTWSDEVWDLYDLGLPARHPDYETWLASVHPDDRAKAADAVTHAAEEGVPFYTEWRVATHDGSLRWLASHGNPERDGGGNVARYVGVVVDITERKLTEETLEKHQATLDAALRSIADGVYISDAVGNPVAINQAFATLNRFAGTEECLKTYEEYPDLFDVYFETWEPAPLDQWAVPRALRGEVANDVLYGVSRKDTGERWIASYSFGPIRGEQGEILGTVVIGRDVTEQFEARRALAESESRHRILFESMRQGVVYQDTEGRITSANPAARRILGLAPDQPSGRPPGTPGWHAVREDGTDFAREDQPPSVALATGREVHDTVMGVFSPAEQAYRWVTVDAIPQFRPGEDRPYRVFTTFNDITERRRAEAEVRRLNAELEARVVARTAQLEGANEELEAFAYSASHDLRAPLRAIDGFSALVAAGAADRLTPQELEDLERVRAAAQRMGVLIDDIMRLSRASRRVLVFTLVDVTAMATEILDELRLSEPDRAVETVVAPGMSASADPSLLRVALENLLANAWKFTSRHPNARIEVGERQGGEDAVFFVTDDGAGFDQAGAGHLFTAFQRLHPPGDFEGSGIGLATVRRIVARHGGRVWAEGAPEHGATFWFSLPKAAPGR